MKKIYKKYLSICGVKYWLAYIIATLLINLIGRFAHINRQVIGSACLKDYIITFNFRIASQIFIPSVSFFMLVYLIRMFDDNRVVRFVNIRMYYVKLLAGCIMVCTLCLTASYVLILLSGLIYSGYIVDNWGEMDSFAYNMYGEMLSDISFFRILTAVFIVWFLIEFINIELCIIIHRFSNSWIIGYIICQFINFCMCLEIGKNKYIDFFINYSVYRNGWNASSVLPLVVGGSIGFVFIMLMGKADNLRKRI